jgi:DNA-binding response OmpR family regulator
MGELMARILVIDDEPSIAELIHDALTRTGDNVKIALNGRQGLQLLSDDAFDLVVTDMCMPDLNGDCIVRQVRHSSRPFTPVIGISGTPWLLEHVGCDAILAKPFRLISLIETVARLKRENLSIASEPPTTPCSFNSQTAS